MNETLDRIVSTREEAHVAATQAYQLAQTLLMNGARVKFHVAEDQDPITIKQRAFLHAAVFPQISEQVVVDGTRYTADIWKEFFRKRFLPDKWKLVAVPRYDAKLGRLVQPKRKTPHRVRVSTEDLGVKAYSDHIDKVIDTAVLEHGVEFVFIESEREEVRYRMPARKPHPSTTSAERPQTEEETQC